MAVPGVPNIFIKYLQTLVWFCDVNLMIWNDFRAVVHCGKDTGIAIMGKPHTLCNSLQHPELNLCQTDQLVLIHSHLPACYK